MKKTTSTQKKAAPMVRNLLVNGAPGPSTTDLFDALSQEINRTDALTFLVAERLEALNELPDAPSELYALSLVAYTACERLQAVLDQAHALHKATGGAR
jgi:hypothetical protein